MAKVTKSKVRLARDAGWPMEPPPLSKILASGTPLAPTTPYKLGYFGKPFFFNGCAGLYDTYRTHVLHTEQTMAAPVEFEFSVPHFSFVGDGDGAWPECGYLIKKRLTDGVSTA
jgi:hypothetical protein